MHPPLEEWDVPYLHSIAAPGETPNLEKKAAPKFDPSGNKKDTDECLAKQVCAFANSGNGFLVFGINDAGGLDAGVMNKVGRQPIKAWVEARIPKLLYPPVNGCRVSLIYDSAHHAPGYGALVIEVPLSESRPHWIPGEPDRAYIRAGEHSLLMKHQTLLDIANRGNVPRGRVESLVDTPTSPGTEQGTLKILLHPTVLLHGGPHCKAGEWTVTLEVPVSAGGFEWHTADIETMQISQDRGRAYMDGTVVLFPGRPTALRHIWLKVPDRPDNLNTAVTAILYAGPAQPEKRSFSVRDLLKQG
jgi:hypothetical protein